MKNQNSKDKSTPYRTLSAGKINAPTKAKADEPRSVVIKGAGDLRSKSR